MATGNGTQESSPRIADGHDLIRVDGARQKYQHAFRYVHFR